MLKNKKIILAVSGSIAAYKTPELTRLLIREGADVQVIATEAALTFVSALSLATVSRHQVYSTAAENGQWHNHVALGIEADLMLIAPASANTIAKMAHGLCDNMLLAVYLSARCPVFFAPAMDVDMLQHPATGNNIRLLQSYGNILIDAEEGELASGLTGKGRMADPEHIVDFLKTYMSAQRPLPLAGQQALVTAGPTYEKLDPVRFIGNYSSGKMGIAVAEALADLGAAVFLIQGPGNQQTFHKNIQVTRVESAQQMYEAAVSRFPDCKIAVMAAAVADYRPEHQEDNKIKKNGAESMTLKLVKNPDILATLGRQKKEGQLVIGFALETQHELENAREKLLKKNADYIVMNSLRDTQAGFNKDTNVITLLGSDGSITAFPAANKTILARQLAAAIIAPKTQAAHAEKKVFL